jgi:hypothetical protein
MLESKKSLLTGNKSQVGKKQSKSFLQPKSFSSTGISGTLTSTYLQPTNYEPTVSKPYETPQNAFKLLFNDINNANLLVGDASNVSDWNYFLNLPALGNPFTSVEVLGNEVKLYGGSNIKVKPALMYNEGYQYLVSIVDEIGCITSVGGDAFSYCELLTSVSLPECTIIYGYEDSPYDDYGGFGGCQALANINIPKLVTLGSYALSDNISISTSLNFPLLTTIADGGLSYLSNATSINLPSLETIGASGLSGNNAVTSFVLPNVSLIGDYAFAGCSSLTTISLPKLTTAGNRCFYYCTSLASISLPILETAGDYCFTDCSSLTTINLPVLVSAGIACFVDCSSLTTINLPQCINLGPDCFDSMVFANIIGNTITLTVPSALMTCNSGNPDGDIQELQANNTVTVITV